MRAIIALRDACGGAGRATPVLQLYVTQSRPGTAPHVGQPTARSIALDSFMSHTDPLFDDLGQGWGKALQRREVSLAVLNHALLFAIELEGISSASNALLNNSGVVRLLTFRFNSERKRSRK